MSLSVASGSDDRNNAVSKGKSSVNLNFGTMQAYVVGMMGYIGSRVTMDTVRPLNMFLGITGPSFCFSPAAFNSPVKKIDKSTYEKFRSRLRLNFAFFLSNYALVTTGVALVTALMHPGMVISVILIWGLWALHRFLISNELILFGRNIGTLVSISHRSTALVILTGFVLVWKCLKPTITVISISGIIILTHALLRDPSHVTSGDFHSGSGHHSTSDDDSGNSHDSEVLVESPDVIRPNYRGTNDISTTAARRGIDME
eukprot:CAMPEP_0172400864 /NCGR_PEP_ID=MMETSP1061-20121228/47781_1 /TAXON_ID=37318 /ORGANISM="Pseudo-nitzschia pungens, Strain cf. pungens" /LENGTH=257 /DNA_ID=CAMNT_0013134291 /DNA_START=132 /DNA_END=906 /DNA_ORIENTATION=+